ncbi:MAG: hypothetical protein R3220_11070 [Balneolaceae bacterium]|nr:hypothetical protein [Balneolaceae bacterium]
MNLAREHIMKFEKIENITLIGTILTFLLFASIGFNIGLYLLLGVLIGLKIYMYSLYKKEGKADEFWIKSSKPALIGLVTLSLLLVLEYFGVFQLIY